jgi:hypothetical protein
MRFWNDVTVLICAACFAGATACSDDGDTSDQSNPLQPLAGAPGFAGAAGASGNAAASGGRGGSANAGVAGSSGATEGPGSAGSAGSAGATGNAPVAEADAGAGDAGGEPAPAVGFSDVVTILQDNCGGCHGTPGSFLPAFAQTDEDAAYEVTQDTSNNGDDLYYERIIARGVVERTMPPSCNGGMLGADGCLSEEDAALLEAWVEQGALP